MLFAPSQRFLRLLLVRNVDGNAADQRRRTVQPDDRKPTYYQMPQAAVVIFQGLHHLHAGAAGYRLPVVLSELVGISAREDVGVRLAVKFRPWCPKGQFNCIVGVNISAFRILDPGQAGQMLHEAGETLFAVTQDLFATTSFVGQLLLELASLHQPNLLGLSLDLFGLLEELDESRHLGRRITGTTGFTR